MHKLMAMPVSVSESAPKRASSVTEYKVIVFIIFIQIHAAFMCPNDVGYGSICIPLAL